MFILNFQLPNWKYFPLFFSPKISPTLKLKKAMLSNQFILNTYIQYWMSWTIWCLFKMDISLDQRIDINFYAIFPSYILEVISAMRSYNYYYYILEVDCLHSNNIWKSSFLFLVSVFICVFCFESSGSYALLHYFDSIPKGFDPWNISSCEDQWWAQMRTFVAAVFEVIENRRILVRSTEMFQNLYLIW